MLIKVLLLSALLVATSACAQNSRMAGEESETPATLCELLSVNPDSVPSARLVSVTAFAYYDFEYGYFLADHECEARDTFSGTGLLKIEFPGRAPEAFPELERLSSQEFLAASVGKRIYCACAGTIDYSGGYPRFVLRSGRVWAD